VVRVIKEEKSAVVFSFELKDKEYGEKTRKLGNISDIHSVERGIARTTQDEGMCFTCIQVLPDPELQKEVDVIISVDLFAHMDITAA
jgi:outer membrane protein assembly factor BamA